MSWKVSTPKVCSTTLPTPPDNELVNACVARAARMSVWRWLGFCIARSSAFDAVDLALLMSRRASLKRSASTSTGGSGGSDSKVGMRRSLVPAAVTVTR